MEVKQRGNALGYKILLFIYKVLGYRFVAFILNFVALYYLFFTPSVKKSMRSYYEHQGIKFTNKAYFNHIKMFALSIFDRFVSRIKPEDLTFTIQDREKLKIFENGAIALLSHVGGWGSAAQCLKDRLPLMHVVMKENTQENISKIEQSRQRYNEQSVKIIDLNQGPIAANVQIANALMAKEIVAMMADRVVDRSKTVEVEFFGSRVQINKNPFDIVLRTKKPLATIFVINTGVKKYDLIFDIISLDSVTNMAQSYAKLLEDILKKHPEQWYNFYDYFKEGIK